MSDVSERLSKIDLDFIKTPRSLDVNLRNSSQLDEQTDQNVDDSGVENIDDSQETEVC